ncbi:MAG: hypothetical protein JNJ54_28495 [Myxococcaceae bacterium]|nr:hypothetical protein [Myxococcaceae bacterium]
MRYLDFAGGPGELNPMRTKREVLRPTARRKASVKQEAKKLGRPVTPGSKAVETELSHWLARSGVNRGEFATKLGMERTSFDRYARGERVPDVRLAFRIEDLTDGAVPARSWVAVLELRETQSSARA